MNGSVVVVSKQNQISVWPDLHKIAEDLQLELDNQEAQR